MWCLRVDAEDGLADDVFAAVWALGVGGVQVEDGDTGAPPGRVIHAVWLPAGAARAAIEAAVRAEVAARRGAAAAAGLTLAWSVAAGAKLPGAGPIGRRFRVLPLDGPPPRPGRRRPLRVDAAAAWGDGRHGSTRAAVALLEDHALEGQGLLDFGCGAGLLSLVALERGAASVCAIDTDGLAQAATARAAEAAGRAHQLQVAAALPEGCSPFDGVMANLPHAVLVEWLPRICAAVAPSGWLLVAGCPRSLWPRLGLGDAGWSVQATRRSGAWGAWLLRRSEGEGTGRVG